MKPMRRHFSKNKKALAAAGLPVLFAFKEPKINSEVLKFLP